MSDIMILILGVLLRTVTENVNQILNSPPKGSKMHFLQVFERIRNGDNKRVAETNKTKNYVSRNQISSSLNQWAKAHHFHPQVNQTCMPETEYTLITLK